MISTLSVAMSLALAAAASPRALVVSYQASGVDDADVERLSKALRSAVETHGWKTVEELTALRQVKSAAMCGEDAACLATVGKRTEAQWVLAFSVGKTSKGVILSTLLVEVASAQRKSGSIEKLDELPEDFTNLARTLVDPLYRDVPTAVALTPAQPKVAPPMVAGERKHPLRGAGAGLLVGGGLVGVGGLVLSIVAGSHHASLKTMGPEQRATADRNQRVLNASADVAVGVGIAALATGLVLLIADAASSPKPAEAEGEAQ